MEKRFDWDPAKAASNLRKHGVSFDTAILVFGDPFALSEQDRVEGGERRWRTIGMVEGRVLLLVAHTLDDEDESGRSVEVVRVISARAVTPKERRRYEQENR